MALPERERFLAGNAAAPSRLRRHITALALVYGVVWSLCAWFLGSRWGGDESARWMLFSVAILVYQWATLWRHAKDNRRTDSHQVQTRIGVGTHLSLGRGFLLAVTGGFLCSARPPGALAWLPAISYTLAILLDYFDGYVARLYADVTLLGERLDTELDAEGMLVSSALAVWYGSLPVWFLVVGALRYGFQLGKWIWRQTGRTVHALPPSRSRRPIAGLTMGYLSAALWPIFSPPETVVAGAIFGLAMLLSFTRDWLVVSGWLDPQGVKYLEMRQMANRFLFGWLPLVIRALIPALIFPAAWGNIARNRMLTSRPVAGGPSADPLVALAFGLTELAAGILVVLGLAGRASALLMLVPIALTISASGMDLAWALRLVAAILILALGSGRFSLWRPEDQIFNRRAGSSEARET